MPVRDLKTGDTFGRISIPRIGLAAVIVEGIDDKTLRHAVGHIPQTGEPWDSGNIGLAGHRDTFFRHLDQVRKNDLILLQARGLKYRYQVSETSVVEPENGEVLQSIGQAQLTLVTCYPFRYIGPAPKRFIVKALRISG